MRNLYEITYLVSGNIEEERIKETHEKLLSLIQEKGILVNAQLPKKRLLAYPIKKQKTAFLGVALFQMDGGNLPDFEKSLKKEPHILRYLILKKKSTKEKPQLKTPLKTKQREKPKKVEIGKLEEKLKEIIGE